MAWIGDTFFSVVLSFLSGAAVNCPEDTTTVRQDFMEMGRRSVHLLLREIGGGTRATTRETVPSELVVRASTAAPSS